MDKPFTLIRTAFRDFMSEAFLLLMFNLFWLLAQFVIIPGPPATLALFRVSQRAVYGQSLTLRDFWEAFKDSLIDGWKWGLLNLVVIAILGNAAVFYSARSFGSVGLIIAIVNLVWLILWILVQLLACSFWLVQDEKRIFPAIWEGIMLLTRKLRLTLVGFLLLVLVLVVSILIPIFIGVGGAAFLTVFGNRVVTTYMDVLTEGENPGR